MEPRECGTCRFWKLGEKFKDVDLSLLKAEDVKGLCRRHAPVVTFCTNEDYPTETEWPGTAKTDYCGDHKFEDEPHHG